MAGDAPEHVEEGKVQEGTPQNKGVFAGFKSFFTEGSARWQTLGVVLLIGVCVAIVTTNTNTIDNLRQNLLLKNKDGAGDEKTHRIRAALSGVDPLHHEWDDVHHVKPTAAGLQARAATPRASNTAWQTNLAASPRSSRNARRAQSNVDKIRSGCVKTCTANGYSPTVSGSTATKACVDVCLEEKGVRLGGPTSALDPGLSASSLQTLRSRSVHTRGRTNSGPMVAAQRLLARLQSGPSVGGPAGSKSRVPAGSTLGSIMQQLGVDTHKLPKKEAAGLMKAVQMDQVIRTKERNGRNSLRAEWEDAEKKMLTFEAARLTNAKNLAAAARKARKENEAKQQLDESLVMAAKNYEQSVGGNSNKGLPVDASKAEKQLRLQQREASGLQAAEQRAGEIFKEEEELWANAKPLTQKQLQSAHWVMPGQRAQSAQWKAALAGANLMPKADAAAVRVAAMSNGRLVGMEESEYKANRAQTEKTMKELQGLTAARAANAELVKETMGKAAGKKAAEAHLLEAEGQFVSAGGKLSPQAMMVKGGPQALGSQVQRDEQEVQELEVAAHGAAVMLERYGENVRRSVQAGGRGLAKVVDQATAVSGAGASGEAEGTQQGEQPLGAVQSASTGAKA
eukprot:CAMPEP_0181325528 /NCGR_PEP_ID=MMETSP1101-20121128/20981_1 /TAXON_ID=46948 /ORGANISM="Rhodomonas abbreviata, Strain Caron Lab Isolate" /LENGTH=623 /DNA_ID=CAMNT_0023433857 /DNA_START=1 /DNA_END=1868 /DNA_ORIENTATION=+